MTSFRQIEDKLAKILIEQKNYATLYLRGPFVWRQLART